jgi:hypothetical protein
VLIVELMSAIVDGNTELDEATPLDALGLSDDLTRLALWDALVEECSERGIGEPDLDELSSATTVGELARCVLRHLSVGNGERRPSP